MQFCGFLVWNFLKCFEAHAAFTHALENVERIRCGYSPSYSVWSPLHAAPLGNVQLRAAVHVWKQHYSTSMSIPVITIMARLCVSTEKIYLWVSLYVCYANTLRNVRISLFYWTGCAHLRCFWSFLLFLTWQISTNFEMSWGEAQCFMLYSMTLFSKPKIIKNCFYKR